MDRVVFCSQLDKKTLARIHGLLPNDIVNAMQSVFVGREDDTYITKKSWSVLNYCWLCWCPIVHTQFCECNGNIQVWHWSKLVKIHGCSKSPVDKSCRKRRLFSRAEKGDELLIQLVCSKMLLVVQMYRQNFVNTFFQSLEVRPRGKKEGCEKNCGRCSVDPVRLSAL